MEYQKRSHSVYLLTYHIVFVTKYRKPVISDEIGNFMKRHAAYLCRRFDGELVTAETDTDHIHLLVSLPPQVCPADLIRTLKTQLSKEVHLNETYNAYVQKYLPVVAVLFYCDDWHQCTGKGEGIHQRTKDR